jgi:hypothetical protein
MTFGISPRVTSEHRWLGLATVVAVLLSLASIGPAGASVTPSAGAVKPPAAAGIGTAAALHNPRCAYGDPQFGPDGRFNSMIAGGGSVCVKPWHAGEENGGATAPGVTKSTITVVGIVPNDQELEGVSRAAGTMAVNRADDATGTYKDAVHDYLLAEMPFYETWGRDIEMKFVTSSGTDESAQRSDAVAVVAKKPFAAINFVGVGLDVLETELAKSKILVWGAATTSQKALAAAPYRWGLSDAQAAAVNAAEVIGKQLVAKKAKFAGDAVIQKQTRKLGVVYIPTLIDVAQFKSALAKYHGTVASENAYTSNGTTFGDDTLAQEQAPVIVTKMKNAGVTTVVLFSDVAMNKALMAQATKQDWFPEWYLTGSVFQDIAIFARGYDQQQFAHAFGVSNLPPYTQPDPTPTPPAKSLTVLTNALNWYWGEHSGTEVPSNMTTRIPWLLDGIQAAGPELTPRTFQQGLFAVPATGGAASGTTTGALTGYGRNAGLPYDEYLQLGLDFAPVWWDAQTTGPSNGTGTVAKGVVRYVDGAKRYRAGTWPTKAIPWFQKPGSVVAFDTRQPPIPRYLGDCKGCPATGGPGQPGTPSPDGFVARANGGDAPLP